MLVWLLKPLWFANFKDAVWIGNCRVGIGFHARIGNAGDRFGSVWCIRLGSRLVGFGFVFDFVFWFRCVPRMPG